MNKEIVDQDFSVTEKALMQIKKIKSENSIGDEFGLRIGVKGGGCSGYTYSLGFDSKEREGDSIIEIDDVKLYIDGKSLFYISGTQLDYTDGLSGRGFVFNNPNAENTCGCGSSFGVK